MSLIYSSMAPSSILPSLSGIATSTGRQLRRIRRLRRPPPAARNLLPPPPLAAPNAPPEPARPASSSSSSSLSASQPHPRRVRPASGDATNRSLSVRLPRP
uniref:Uncharacterized protein n=1 Tax=Triticum urartu TaxID=4572 RepID=A0A8R7U035_TRIUA